jgi:hypothetical protein
MAYFLKKSFFYRFHKNERDSQKDYSVDYISELINT